MSTAKGTLDKQWLTDVGLINLSLDSKESDSELISSGRFNLEEISWGGGGRGGQAGSYLIQLYEYI